MVELDFENPTFVEALRNAKPVQETAELDIQIPTSVETPTIDVPITETTPLATEIDTPLTPSPTIYNWEEKSGGLFKNEEDFIKALDKVKNYDSIEKKLKETETKLPQFKNEIQQKIFEALINGNENEVKTYWAEKDKPYATMSDIDVMRNALKIDNPQWDDKRVELAIRKNYGRKLELIDTSNLDPELDKEELKDATYHNTEVEKNLELLQADAYDRRIELLKRQQEIGLPEFKKTEAQPIQNLSEAEILEAKQKWQKGLEEDLPKLNSIKVDIDDKGVEYVSTDDDKASLKAVLSDFNILKFFGENRGWQNPDKSWNRLKIAEDVRFLTEGQKVIKSIANQVKTETIKETMKKIKNIDPIVQNSDGTPKKFATLEEAAQNALSQMRAKKANVEYEEQD